MGKKKKRLRAEQKQHDSDQWHEIVTEFISSHSPTDMHVVPNFQPWHLPEPWCFCRPVVISEHPLTGKKVYSHQIRVH